MKSKNNGNIKLASLLFILGSSSAVLLIPAVIQKESSEPSSAIHGTSNNQEVVASKNENPIIKTYEVIKKEYIEQPIQKISETTKEITTIIENPAKIIYQENEAANSNSSPLSYILGEATKEEITSSSTTTNQKDSEAMIRITKQMVDNCKLITEEYNKISK